MAQGVSAGLAAQEALPDPGRECFSAAPAHWPCNVLDALGCIRGGVGGDADFGVVAGPCNQWSIGRAARGTLMRHDVCTGHRLRRERVDTVVPDAPAPRARCVGHASAAAALVAPAGFTLRGLARQARTGRGAVALTAVAAAAKPDLGRAPCAQEQAGGTVQTHLGHEPKVLDGRVPARHTVVAPPSSARCKVRRGRPPAKRWTAAVPDLLRHRCALYNA